MHGSRLSLVMALGMAAAAFAPSASASTGYRTYTNARFGFTMSYPAGFAVQPPPVNGDGREWRSDHGRVSLIASGQNNVDGTTPKRQAAEDSRGVQVVYRRVSGQVVTVSGYVQGGRVIVYRRSVVGRGSINSLTWRYPRSQKARWDAAVAATARRFRPGDVTSPH
jgi:hypothetical protein